MARLFCVVVLTLLAAPLVAAPVPKSLKKPSAESEIVGLWCTAPGGSTGWYFRPDGTAGLGDPATNSGCKAVYRVDASQSPKHLDWSQDEGKTWYLGVYEIENDVLRINFGSCNTGVRPPAVGPNLGSQHETGTRHPTILK